MSRSWERPRDGNGRGRSTASQRRGSAPALARWRQVRRATHLEGRSRKRSTCASKLGGRLVSLAIILLHRQQRWRGGRDSSLFCGGDARGGAQPTPPSIERIRVQVCSMAARWQWQWRRRQRRPLARVQRAGAGKREKGRERER